MEYHKRWCLEGRPREQFESFRLYENAKRLFRKEQRRLIRKSEENDFKELSVLLKLIISNFGNMSIGVETGER